MQEEGFHALLHREVEVPDGRERWLEKGAVVEVYTDGGTIGWNGIGGSVEGASWAWCGVNKDGERVVEKSGLLLPDSRYKELRVGVTNNHAEFYAVCKALAFLPDGWDGVLKTDSMTMIYRWMAWKNGKRKAMENTPVRWQRWFRQHLGRLGTVCFEWVPGHEAVEQNEWCDAECTRLAIEHLRLRVKV